MEVNVLKEVYFDKYCDSCEYKENEEKENPCNECLNEPVNANSHKPTKYVKGNQ